MIVCSILVMLLTASGNVPVITGVSDRPNDAGDGLDIVMEPLPLEDDLMAYVVFRKHVDEPVEFWVPIFVLAAPLESTLLQDGFDPDFPLVPGELYMYRPAAITLEGDTLWGEAYTSSVAPVGEWFNTDVIPVFAACAIFIFMIFYYFRKAKTGKDFYLRPIAGIEAIDEAIGRATEMGRPILYVPGLSTISDVATIASLTILGRVAKKVAEYQTSLMVPNCDPIVYTVADEAVKQAYLEAGRPDSYDPDSVFFITQSQFAFVAGVNGIMMREKPATNFYLGMFWAESLLLAETGSLSGAIQIAGTDAVTQLPFFITTCDYTLIGEELYAASAYLGREPKQIGAVKSQDALKMIVMLLIIFGLVLSTLATITGNDTFYLLRNWITVTGGN
jgi:hypothetical protein